VIQRPASRYIAREMAISGAINGALSIAFFLAVVGTDGPLPIWDLRNFALDLWPQSFAIGLMAALIPGLLCRRTIRRGALRSIDGSVPGVGLLMKRAAVSAVSAVGIGSFVVILGLWTAGLTQIGYAPAIIFKALYGVILGAFVTWLTLSLLVETSAATDPNSTHTGDLGGR